MNSVDKSIGFYKKLVYIKVGLVLKLLTLQRWKPRFYLKKKYSVFKSKFNFFFCARWQQLSDIKYSKNEFSIIYYFSLSYHYKCISLLYLIKKKKKSKKNCNFLFFHFLFMKKKHRGTLYICICIDRRSSYSCRSKLYPFFFLSQCDHHKCLIFIRHRGNLSHLICLFGCWL